MAITYPGIVSVRFLDSRIVTFIEYDFKVRPTLIVPCLLVRRFTKTFGSFSKRAITSFIIFAFNSFLDYLFAIFHVMIIMISID